MSERSDKEVHWSSIINLAEFSVIKQKCIEWRRFWEEKNSPDVTLCPVTAAYQKIKKEVEELQELNQKWSERFENCQCSNGPFLFSKVVILQKKENQHLSITCISLSVLALLSGYSIMQQVVMRFRVQHLYYSFNVFSFCLCYLVMGINGTLCRQTFKIFLQLPSSIHNIRFK